MEKQQKKLFVLDTNVILHDSESLSSFEEHDIAIPIEVISELDKFKKGSDSINFNAREAIREIEKLPVELLYDGGTNLGEGLGKLRIIVGYPFHENVRKIFSPKEIDHQILNAAYNLSISEEITKQGIKVILVSKDGNLRLKAGALGIAAEDYKNDFVPNANSFYTKAQEILASEEEVKELYSKGKINLQRKENLYENEFIFLESDKNTALACFKKKEIHLVTKGNSKPFGISALNAEQTFAMSALLDPNISFVTLVGKAGTGKTLIAAAVGLQLLREGKANQVYFTRVAIGLANRDIGYLPGDAKEKLSPYMRGIYDNVALLKSIGKNKETIERFEKDETFVMEPLTFIRGRSIPKTYFIVDEAQNLTPKEAKAIMTRAGEDTKIIFMGDITQIDSPYLDQNSNGLSYVISKFKGQSVYAHVALMKGERSYLAELASDLL